MMPTNMPNGNVLFSVVDGGRGVQDQPFNDKRLIEKSDQCQIITCGHKTGKYDAALVGTPKGRVRFRGPGDFFDVCYCATEPQRPVFEIP